MKTTAAYFLFFALAIYTVKSGIIPAWQSLHSDFPNYYLSSQIIREGTNVHRLYDDAWFNRTLQERGLATEGKFSPFPPATALVMLPLASFSPLTAKRIWTVINGLVLVGMIVLLQRITAWPLMVSAIVVLILGQGVSNNFRLGQLYLVLAFLVLLSHTLTQRGHSGLAGVLLGVCAIIKYFPIVFIMGYGLAGQRKLVGYATATMVAMTFLQIGMVDPDGFGTYLSKVLLPHLHGDLSMQTPYAVAFRSWESLLRHLFVFHPTENPHPLFDWPFGKWLVQITVYLLIFGSAIYLLWLGRRLPPSQRLALYLSVPALAAMVALPASATYHFLLLTFPFALFITLATELCLPRKLIYVAVLAYAGVGWMRAGFLSEWAFSGWGVVLLFPRLWLLTFLYAVCAWALYRRFTQRTLAYA